ncbi:MAG: thiamine biosynthesis protein ThiC [Erythrobacter sp.]
MDYTFQRTAKITAGLLIAIAVTQAVYTALYIAEVDINRGLLWGAEGILFVAIAAFAGGAMVQSKRFAVGWSAIAFSAVLNVVQVGVGLTMFGPFREGAESLDALAPLAGAVVAFSFFVYNAAKVLLAFAALIFGLAKMNASVGGGKALGAVTAIVGAVALASNAAIMVLGRGALGQLPISGGSGVLATLLLGLILVSATRDND